MSVANELLEKLDKLHTTELAANIIISIKKFWLCVFAYRYFSLWGSDGNLQWRTDLTQMLPQECTCGIIFGGMSDYVYSIKGVSR